MIEDDEDIRAAKLIDAQAKAAELFEAIGARGLVMPGVTETAASDAVRDLAADMFGVTRHWHKRIIRAGPNTLQPYPVSSGCGTHCRSRSTPGGRTSKRTRTSPASSCSITSKG
jgi:hypothetical protein